jgi:hypothetical protein
MSPDLARAMPSLAAHAGVWAGVYRHLDAEGRLIDQHRARIRCEFPAAGPYAYIQHNLFQWDDGREYHATLPGILRDGRLWWDVETFSGVSWEAGDGVILLNLTRKDDPGAHFIEMITLFPSGQHRARTWHWFKDGRLFKRTLCDETRMSPQDQSLRSIPEINP